MWCVCSVGYGVCGMGCVCVCVCVWWVWVCGVCVVWGMWYGVCVLCVCACVCAHTATLKWEKDNLCYVTHEEPTMYELTVDFVVE